MIEQELAAKQAIKELVFRYCRAIDRRDFEMLATLYAEDSLDEHGDLFSGSGDDFVKWVPSILATMHATSHQVMNHLIALDPDNPDYAEGEVYIQAYHLMDGEGGERIHLIGGGRYLDKYTRRAGCWQFSHRKIVGDYELVLPVHKSGSLSLVDGQQRGQDPSMEFFRLI